MTVAVQKGNQLLLVIKHNLHTSLFVISALKLHCSKFSGFAVSELPKDNYPTIPLSLTRDPSNSNLELVRY